MLRETVPLRVASCVIIEIVLAKNHKRVFKIFFILFLLRYKGKKVLITLQKEFTYRITEQNFTNPEKGFTLMFKGSGELHLCWYNAHHASSRPHRLHQCNSCTFSSPEKKKRPTPESICIMNFT